MEIVEYNLELFENILELYKSEGWNTFIHRRDDAIEAWNNSNVTFVIIENKKVIAALRAVTDGFITMYVAEIVVDKSFRGQGLGKKLLDYCHSLYPKTRIDLLSTEEADDFYIKNGFKESVGFRKSYL